MPEGNVLIIDASVAINLNATRRAAEIIAASPYRFLMTTNARAELHVTGRRGRNDAGMLGELIAEGLVSCETLPEEVLDDYFHLVSGSALATLDDGEAATIVLARSMGAAAGLDERKARALCFRTSPSLRVVSSVDLLLSAEVRAGLGPKVQAEAIYMALKDARMQVHGQCLAAVVDLIGTERARTCPSLPSSVR